MGGLFLQLAAIKILRKEIPRGILAHRITGTVSKSSIRRMPTLPGLHGSRSARGAAAGSRCGFVWER